MKIALLLKEHYREHAMQWSFWCQKKTGYPLPILL